jgi:hypothetical protein
MNYMGEVNKSHTFVRVFPEILWDQSAEIWEESCASPAIQSLSIIRRRVEPKHPP